MPTVHSLATEAKPNCINLNTYTKSMLNADEGVIDDSSVPSVSELSTMVPCHSADPLINTINSLLTAVLGNLKYRSAQCPQIESAIDTDQHLRELSATIISGIGRVSGSLLDHLREGDVRVPTLQTYFSDATNDPGAGIYLLSYGNSVDDQHQQPEIYAGSFGQEVATMPEGLPKRSAEPMVRRLLKAGRRTIFHLEMAPILTM